MKCSSVLLSAATLLSVVTAGSAEVTLKLKHVEGAKSVAEITSKTHQILTIAGMDVETKSETTMNMSFTNGKRDEQGNLPVKQKIESLFVQAFLPNGLELTFDSANPDVENDIPQLKALLETWNALAGSGFTLILDKNDKAVEVRGSDDALEGLSEMAAALLKDRLDANYLKQVANQELGKLPTEPVSKGSSWTRTEGLRLGGGQSMVFQKRYTYLGTVEKNGKTLDKIRVVYESVDYSVAADSPGPLKVVGSDLKIASSEGTLLFDRQLGEEVESSTKFQIKGDMKFSAGGQELPGELDLTIESKSVWQR